MKYYFSLQFKRTKRWFTEFGIHPYLALVLGLILFILLSTLLFFKTEYADYIYLFLAVAFLFNRANKTHLSMLNHIFDTSTRIKIRLIENGMIATPFILYLLYEKSFLFIPIIILAAIIFSFLNLRRNFHGVIPTPFKNFPFENIQGFRISFFFFAMDYFIIFKAIQVDNYNLAAVSMFSMFFVCMSYYLKPEKIYFVWIFNENPDRFLMTKLKYALVCASIIVVPAVLIISFYFSSMIWFTLAIMLLGYIYLSSVIFAKYSAYPKEMNLPQAFLYVLSIILPVILLFIFPIFYKRSKKNLSQILE